MTELVYEKEILYLLPEKAIYWKERSSLFIADLHFGKTNHFRKEGIAIPSDVIEQDFDRLHALLLKYPAQNIYFLGDLFHSRINNEWEILIKLISNYNGRTFHLVIGNHDILNQEKYTEAGIILHENPLAMGPFLLSHEPIEKNEDSLLNLCGHIHPGVIIKGKGRQRVRLPCFYKTKTFLILPAFGTFTGLKALSILKSTRVFAVTEESVMEIGYKNTA